MKEYTVYFTDGSEGPLILARSAVRAFGQAEAIFGSQVAYLEECPEE